MMKVLQKYIFKKGIIIGTYRLIFKVNQEIITIKVIKIGSREGIYK